MILDRFSPKCISSVRSQGRHRLKTGAPSPRPCASLRKGSPPRAAAAQPTRGPRAAMRVSIKGGIREGGVGWRVGWGGVAGQGVEDSRDRRGSTAGPERERELLMPQMRAHARARRHAPLRPPARRPSHARGCPRGRSAGQGRRAADAAAARRLEGGSPWREA